MDSVADRAFCQLNIMILSVCTAVATLLALADHIWVREKKMIGKVLCVTSVDKSRTDLIFIIVYRLWTDIFRPFQDRK